jgi:hypothetical protein
MSLAPLLPGAKAGTFGSDSEKSLLEPELKFGFIQVKKKSCNSRIHATRNLRNSTVVVGDNSMEFPVESEISDA